MAKIRNCSSPQQESLRYVHFDEATINRLIDAKLTAAQYRAVLYFALVDPFGNRFVDAEGPIARQRLGISKSTYYEALGVLEDEGLFSFEDVTLRVRNCIGSKSPEKYSDEKIVRKIEPESEKSDRSPKNRTGVRKIGPESEKSEKQSLRSCDINPSESAQYHSIEVNKDQNNSLKEKETQISEFEIEPNYRNWLLAKASRLPNPPALRELWLEKQSTNPANLREYDAWQADQQQTDPSPPPCPLEQTELGDESIEAKLGRYQRLWSVEVMRKGIQNAIASHPEWNIDIGPEGPRWRSISQQHTPEPEPDISAEKELYRVENTSSQKESPTHASQSLLTSLLPGAVDRWHIDSPQLQAAWDLAASPLEAAVGHISAIGQVWKCDIPPMRWMLSGGC